MDSAHALVMEREREGGGGVEMEGGVHRGEEGVQGETQTERERGGGRETDRQTKRQRQREAGREGGEI